MFNPHSDEVIAFAKALGLPFNTQRVIIDIDWRKGTPVKVYFTVLGDEKAFDVAFKDGDFEIVQVDRSR